MHVSIGGIILVMVPLLQILTNGAAGNIKDLSFFLTDEQHDTQIPIPPNMKTESVTLTGKLRTIIQKGKQRAVSKSTKKIVIIRPEVETRDSLLDDKYKPWGASSRPIYNITSNQVILDSVDDELFTPNSERHSYDERSHEDVRAHLG